MNWKLIEKQTEDMIKRNYRRGQKDNLLKLFIMTNGIINTHKELEQK